MKLENWTIKGFLAIYIVVFCTLAMAFLDLQQMIVGAFISMLSGVFGYYFGSIQGKSAQDKALLESKTVIADIGGSNNPKPDPNDK